MRRYFFDIHDGVVVTDPVGQELPDLATARACGLQIAAAYAGQPGMTAQDGGVIVVTIRDAPDSVLMTVRLVFNVETGMRARGGTSESVPGRSAREV